MKQLLLISALTLVANPALAQSYTNNSGFFLGPKPWVDCVGQFSSTPEGSALWARYNKEASNPRYIAQLEAAEEKYDEWCESLHPKYNKSN